MNQQEWDARVEAEKPRYERVMAQVDQDLAQPRARATDPETSHDAAEKVKDVTLVQNIILLILWTGGSMTDPQIAEYYYGRVADGSAPNHSESGLRTRRNELVKMGKIKATGEKDKLDTGRYATLWAYDLS